MKILIDDEKETRVQLKLYLTYDLLMELLSFGANMRVIEPQTLIDQMKQVYKNALEP